VGLDRFEQVVCALNVDRGRGGRVVERDADAGPGGQVHHPVDALQRLVQVGALPDVAFDDLRPLLGQGRGGPALDRRVVVGVEVVEDRDGVTAREQPLRDV